MSSREPTLHFREYGSLEPPGPIGRVVRAALGAACLWLVHDLIVYGDIYDVRNLLLPGWGLFGIILVPYVFNIGFGVSLGKWPRHVTIFVLVVVVAVGWMITRTLLNEWIWIALKTFMLYVYGHLGLSFILSAILATPGCEMRSIPHLIGLATRRKEKIREYPCPGFIGTVDRWEQRRS